MQFRTYLFAKYRIHIIDIIIFHRIFSIISRTFHYGFLMHFVCKILLHLQTFGNKLEIVQVTRVRTPFLHLSSWTSCAFLFTSVEGRT